MKDFVKIQKVIGVKFKNEKLIKQAFIHRSFLNENPEIKEHNERLEFLGDAVLELVVTEYLFENYPNPEGELTNWRSALVKTETISSVAKELGFDEFLYLSKGESKSQGRARQLILANCFEAVTGAIYLDQGYNKAREFILNNLLVLLKEIIEKRLYIDSKSEFQELAQEKDGLTPNYRVLKEEGPDHDRIFTVGVFVGDKLMGKGKGPSKQLAQQEAATEALRKY